MKLQNYKANKQRIIEDMLCSISYTPNRESDILAFMELYQKSDASHRTEVLEQLRQCMDGNEYPNPYERNYGYSIKDVHQIEKLLDDYIDSLIESEGNSDNILRCIQRTKSIIDELNETANGSLIDTWRRDEINKFMDTAAELAGLTQDKSPVFKIKM